MAFWRYLPWWSTPWGPAKRSVTSLLSTLSTSYWAARAAIADSEAAKVLGNTDTSTYKQRAPDGWHGFILVYINAWQAPNNTDHIGRFIPGTKTFTAKLGGFKGQVGYFAGVIYHFVRVDWEIESIGHEKLFDYWDYKVESRGKIVLETERKLDTNRPRFPLRRQTRSSNLF